MIKNNTIQRVGFDLKLKLCSPLVNSITNKILTCGEQSKKSDISFKKKSKVKEPTYEGDITL